MEKVNILVALHTLPIPMYIDLVQEGATVIAESELVHEIELPANVKLVHIPANEIAEKMGNPRGMSAVMAGAVVALADLFPYEDGVKAVSYTHLDVYKRQFDAWLCFLAEDTGLEPAGLLRLT